MGNTIFNTLLIKGENINQLNEIRESIMDINEDGETFVNFISLLKPPQELIDDDEKYRGQDENELKENEQYLSEREIFLEVFEVSDLHEWWREKYGVNCFAWSAHSKMGKDYLLIHCITKNSSVPNWVKSVSMMYPDLFFCLTVSDVMNSYCYTYLGFDGNIFSTENLVLTLDNERIPVFYDNEGVCRFLKNGEKTAENSAHGRCFRNPFILMIDALLENKLVW